MAESGKSQVSADDGCFICGEMNPIGLKGTFSVDADSGQSHAELTLSDNYQGWQGVIHGGIIAALLDEACIYACRSRAEQCVTAEIRVRYRKPVPAGAQVEVKGILIDSSRKIWLTKATLHIDAVLYAEAEARIFILGQES